LEIFFGILVEIISQTVIEVLADVGIRSASGQKRPHVHPLLAILGYAFLAGALAVFSLVFFPHHLIKNPDYRVAGLVISPLVVGILMAIRGGWLKRNEKEPIRIDSFFYGFLFALVFAGVRYLRAI
jgi:hypothetical protein